MTPPTPHSTLRTSHVALSCTSHVALLIAIACLSRCSGPPQSPPKQASALDAIVAQYEQILDQLPNSPNIDPALDEIAATAVKEGKIPGQDPRRELIFLFPDNNIGLYLFEQARARLDPNPLDQLLDAIEANAPNSAVDAAAFDSRLAALAPEPEKLLTACSQALEPSGADATRRGRVALYRRAIYQRQAGLPKHAALDLIRLYSLHPDAVKDMHAVPYISATLKDAGFILEADLLEKSPDPARAAAALWKEFAPAAHALDPQATIDLNATALYLRHAPDVAAIEQTASEPGILDSPLTRALHCARMARIALEAVQPEEAADRYALFTDAAETAINTPDLTQDDSIQLAQTLASSYLACRSFMSNGEQLRPNLDTIIKRLEPKTLALGQKMLTLYLAAWLKTIPTGNDGAEKMIAQVDRVVEWAQRDDHDTVLNAYNTFLDRYPDAPQAPDALAKLADYCQVRMRDSAKAATIYASLINKYPDAPNLEKAVLRQALALYENKDYRAALDTLSAFIQKKTDSPNVATARYMAALAEAALGLTDDAQAHMTSLVNEFPASTLAPRALYWLGMNHIMRQEYQDASDIFHMLADRYPQSEYAQRARSYISNLEKPK